MIMSSNGFEWVTSPDVLTKAIEKLASDLPEAVKQVLDEVGREMAVWAKANAPWKDITGNARNGLTYTVEGGPDLLVLTFGHTVYYGKYLELCNGQRFAIVASTIETHLPVLEARLRGLVE